MENPTPPRESTGKIVLRTHYICLCVGIVGLGSQAKRCIQICIFLQILALTSLQVPITFVPLQPISYSLVRLANRVYLTFS